MWNWLSRCVHSLGRNVMFWCGRAGKLQGTLYEITFRAYLSFKVSLCSALNECYDFLQFCCEFNVRQGTSKANHKALIYITGYPRGLFPVRVHAWLVFQDLACRFNVIAFIGPVCLAIASKQQLSLRVYLEFHTAYLWTLKFPKPYILSNSWRPIHDLLGTARTIFLKLCAFSLHKRAPCLHTTDHHHDNHHKNTNQT